MYSTIWLAALFASQVMAEESYPTDPILALRPAFIMSLPIQLLLTGIVLTLVSVLFIHLIFTAQYHWPLAPVNFVLQMSAVVTLLVSTIATLHVVLDASGNDSSNWPYMLNYMAVEIPRSQGSDPWSFLETFTWSVMTATTSILVQITHIQFLTLLYPSALEARMIYFMLIPLAITSAAMQLVSTSTGGTVFDVSNTVRNICNATLSLLFTISLLVWGFLVNRDGAWRTDGGTAAFGVSALFLALMSTVLNFIYIPTQDQFQWLPGLMWAVVLWQSFLGWWWWVGAGNGMGPRDIEDKRRRQLKKMEKRLKREERARAKKERSKNMWDGLTGTIRIRTIKSQQTEEEDSSIDETTPSPTNENLDPMSGAESPGAVTRNPFAKWYSSIRTAHNSAARRQAVNQAERMEATYGPPQDQSGVSGWGIGSFAIRQTLKLRRDVDEATLHEEARAADENPKTLWWWGPLKKWRHQDSTTYH